MTGFDRLRVVDISAEDLEEFICGICLEIFIKPMVTQCCGQTFCEQCINQWLEVNNNCPNDRKYLTKDQLKTAPKMVTNLLNNLKVKCCFHDLGCTEITKMDFIADHTDRCNFNPHLKCNDCGFNITNHTQSDCIKNLINKMTLLKVEHEQECFKLFEKFKNDQAESISIINQLLNEIECKQSNYYLKNRSNETENQELSHKFAKIQNSGELRKTQITNEFIDGNEDNGFQLKTNRWETFERMCNNVKQCKDKIQQLNDQANNSSFCLMPGRFINPNGNDENSNQTPNLGHIAGPSRHGLENLCTFTITKREYKPQHWFTCKTCKLFNGKGVCVICAKVCHKDHEIQYKTFSAFFCDCGEKGDKSCFALNNVI